MTNTTTDTSIGITSTDSYIGANMTNTTTDTNMEMTSTDTDTSTNLTTTNKNTNMDFFNTNKEASTDMTKTDTDTTRSNITTMDTNTSTYVTNKRTNLTHTSNDTITEIAITNADTRTDLINTNTGTSTYTTKTKKDTIMDIPNRNTNTSMEVTSTNMDTRTYIAIAETDIKTNSTNTDANASTTMTNTDFGTRTKLSKTITNTSTEMAIKIEDTSTGMTNTNPSASTDSINRNTETTTDMTNKNMDTRTNLTNTNINASIDMRSTNRETSTGITIANADTSMDRMHSGTEMFVTSVDTTPDMMNTNTEPRTDIRRTNKGTDTNKSMEVMSTNTSTSTDMPKTDTDTRINLKITNTETSTDVTNTNRDTRTNLWNTNTYISSYMTNTDTDTRENFVNTGMNTSTDMTRTNTSTSRDLINQNMGKSTDMTNSYTYTRSNLKKPRTSRGKDVSSTNTDILTTNTDTTMELTSRNTDTSTHVTNTYTDTRNNFTDTSKNTSTGMTSTNTETGTDLKNTNTDISMDVMNTKAEMTTTTADTRTDISTYSSADTTINEIITSTTGGTEGKTKTKKAKTNDVSSKVIVTVLQRGDKTCDAEFDEKNRRWPVTKVGQKAKFPCPEGTIGNCSRTCSEKDGKATWSEPNCRECVNKQINDALKQIGRLKDRSGFDNKEVSKEVAQKLAEFTNSNESLKTQDLNATVSAINQLVNLKNESKEVPNIAETKSVAKAIDNLLRSSNNESWNNLQQKDGDGDTAAAKLVSSVESIAQRLTQLPPDNTERKIISENMALEAKVLEKENLSSTLTFPQNESEILNYRGDRISLPTAAFDETVWNSNETLSAWSVYILNIGQYLQTSNESYVNSRLLSLTVKSDAFGKNLLEPVTVTLYHNEERGRRYSRKCVFWDASSSGGGNWSEEGCIVIDTDASRTICQCSHLTNFAVLMSREPSVDSVLSLISTIGCSISVFALCLTIFIYAITWKQAKSHQAVLLLNLCVALIAAYVVFLTGAEKVESKAGCKAVAVLLHYFYLAAFFIMLSEGVQLLVYVMFVFHARRKSETAAMLVSAWVLPLLIVAISVGVTKTEGYGNEKFCWLSVENHVIWAFIGPALFVTAINFVVIVLVLRRSSSKKLSSNKNENRGDIRRALWNIAVICPVLGLTWIFGVFSLIWEEVVFQYIFAIINSLQGLFIFIFHGILHSKKISDYFRSVLSKFVSHIRVNIFGRKTEPTTVADTITSTVQHSISISQQRDNTSDPPDVSALVDFYDRQGADFLQPPRRRNPNINIKVE